MPRAEIRERRRRREVADEESGGRRRDSDSASFVPISLGSAMRMQLRYGTSLLPFFYLLILHLVHKSYGFTLNFFGIAVILTIIFGACFVVLNNMFNKTMQVNNNTSGSST